MRSSHTIAIRPIHPCAHTWSESNWMWSTSCRLICDTSTVIHDYDRSHRVHSPSFRCANRYEQKPRETKNIETFYGYSSINYVLLVLICRLEIDQQKQSLQSTNAVSFTMRPVDVQLGMLCCVGRLNGFLCVFSSAQEFWFSHCFFSRMFSIPLVRLFAHSRTANLWGNAQRKLQLRCTSVTRDMETVIGRHNRSD